MPTSKADQKEATTSVVEPPRDLPMPAYDYQDEEGGSFSISVEPEAANSADKKPAREKVLQNICFKS